MKKPIPSAYVALLGEIKERIRSAQYEALKAVNSEEIALYWDIGRIIGEKQRGAPWGRSVVEKLAADLRKEFPGTLGFSASNLWRMKAFYQAYEKDVKLAPLVREIGWSHNIIIRERCRNDLEREFYIRMTRRMGWSKSVLVHQIENDSYHKTLAHQTNFDRALPKDIRSQAKLAVRDEYTLDFLELGDLHSERQLEDAILARMDKFLREMGGSISFVGSQYRIEVSDREYFIDILLYHRHLKCLMALELKVGEFLPEYVGKMQFYLAALDRQVKAGGENPSIGIIVCKSKDKTIVEYALQQSRKPIGVASYRITQRLTGRLRRELPSPEQVANLLKVI